MTLFHPRLPGLVAGSGSRKWKRNQSESAVDVVKKPGPAPGFFLPGG
jgi:hypothetical protein